MYNLILHPKIVYVISSRFIKIYALPNFARETRELYDTAKGVKFITNTNRNTIKLN